MSAFEAIVPCYIRYITDTEFNSTGCILVI